MRATVIVDLQYGSTGKGLLAGFLAKRFGFTACVTAWAPNAGHTFVDAAGRRFVHTQLANGIVGPTVRDVFIGPGSVIDPEALLRELREVSDLMVGKHLYIHANAAVVHQRHREAELELEKIGSTQKGASAAVIERMRRSPNIANTAAISLRGVPEWRQLTEAVVDPNAYQHLLRRHNRVLVEGHQGYSLSIYHGMYPYVTSRDTTVHAILADCGVPRASAAGPLELEVWGTLRTFPIRVSNRYDAKGNQTGTSGPGYPDQREVTWDDVGQAPEFTTVTKRQRRIFTFSDQQVREAAAVNGCDHLFVNFMNYLPQAERFVFCQRVERITGVAMHDTLYGYGATEADVRAAVDEQEAA